MSRNKRAKARTRFAYERIEFGRRWMRGAVVRATLAAGCAQLHIIRASSELSPMQRGLGIARGITYLTPSAEE